MKLRLILLACAAFWQPLLATESARGRFSQAMPNEERAALGLPRLSSDQLAALDALVRRDIAARGSVRADPAAPAVFSQRLSADERRLTGVTLLSAEELARLDGAVERHSSAALARTLLSPPVYAAPRRAAVEPAEKKTKPEIHGTFSLSYGWGKGGYSEKTGSMVVSVEDPSRRFGLTVGYAESHVKGDSVRHVELPRP